MSTPSITALVRVYNGEEFIAETLTAILSQTRSPDEVVVVDDGSTDGTPEELQRFARQVRVVRQRNRGLAAAFNRGFAEARGDYVAICDADDIWLPDKLARQERAVVEHPEIDVAFGAVWVFGQIDGPWGMEVARDHSVGVLDDEAFRRTLYRVNVVCTSSSLVTADLFRRVGPFVEHHGAEDYDFWMRALGAGACFFYDPTTLARYRKHGSQITSSTLAARQSGFEVRLLHTDLVRDRRLVREVLGRDLFRIGRMRVDDGRAREARQAFRLCLRYSSPNTASTAGRAFVWTTVLALPERTRRRAGRAFVDASRALDGLTGRGRPALP